MYKVNFSGDRTPSRGWYSIFSFELSKREDYDELKWSIRRDEDIALARINLREFRECEIPQEALDNLDGILDFFRYHNRELIIRFVYDIDGNGLTNEPKSKKIIRRHMEQIAPYMVKNADIIITMQGVFTGSWGEMHTSRYSESVDIAELAIALYEAAKGAVNIAFRTPAQMAELKKYLDIIKYHDREHFIEKIGLYDDAMLATQTDMGTLAYNAIEEDLGEIGRISEYNFVGGECINDNEQNDGANAVSGLKKRHVTYLNSQYDTQVIDKWKSQKLKDGGGSVFDYLTEHLGYRLEYAGIRHDFFRGRVTVVIKNTGFAPFFGELELAVVKQKDDNTDEPAIICTAAAKSDVKRLLPNEKAYFTFEKKSIPKDVTFAARRVRDGKTVKVFV